MRDAVGWAHNDNGDPEIWVAKGRYTTYSEVYGTYGSLLLSPYLKKLYGGFSGTEMRPSERVLNYESVIDGEFRFDSALVYDGYLDGFTITGARKFGVVGSKVKYCLFTGNGQSSDSSLEDSTNTYHGAYSTFLSDEGEMITRCEFIGNYVHALYAVSYGRIRIVDSKFEDNLNKLQYPDVLATSPVILERCSFDPVKSGPPHQITIIP